MSIEIFCNNCLKKDECKHLEYFKRYPGLEISSCFYKLTDNHIEDLHKDKEEATLASQPASFIRPNLNGPQIVCKECGNSVYKNELLKCSECGKEICERCANTPGSVTVQADGSIEYDKLCDECSKRVEEIEENDRNSDIDVSDVLEYDNLTDYILKTRTEEVLEDAERSKTRKSTVKNHDK